MQATAAGRESSCGINTQKIITDAISMVHICTFHAIDDAMLCQKKSVHFQWPFQKLAEKMHVIRTPANQQQCVKPEHATTSSANPHMDMKKSINITACLHVVARLMFQGPHKVTKLLGVPISFCHILLFLMDMELVFQDLGVAQGIK